MTRHSIYRIFFVLFALSLGTSLSWAEDIACQAGCALSRENCLRGVQPGSGGEDICWDNYSRCMKTCGGSSDRVKLAACKWFGFANANSPTDREGELKEHVGAFERFSSSSPDFRGLCRDKGLRCYRVIDWEGYYHSCTKNGRDGSRLACCMTVSECQAHPDGDDC